MKIKFFLWAILISFLLEATFLDEFRLFYLEPDLLLIWVIIAGLYFNQLTAILLSLLSGILKDTLGVSIFGINTFWFPVLTLLVIKTSQKISLESNLIFCAAVFGFSLLNDLVSRTALLILGYSLPGMVFFRIALSGSLYTTLIASLVFKFIKSRFRDI